MSTVHNIYCAILYFSFSSWKRFNFQVKFSLHPVKWFHNVNVLFVSNIKSRQCDFQQIRLSRSHAGLVTMSDFPVEVPARCYKETLIVVPSVSPKPTALIWSSTDLWGLMIPFSSLCSVVCWQLPDLLIRNSVTYCRGFQSICQYHRNQSG